MSPEKRKIKILFVEDLPSDVELALRVIARENIPFTHIVADTEDKFREALENFRPDIVVSDYSMPAFDGMSALKITLASGYNIPFVMLTGSMNEETAVECMKAGANDYVIKEHINRLPYAIIEAIENNRIRIERDQAEKTLRLLSRSVDQSPVSIVITDSNGMIEYVNPTFSVLTGYSFDESIGKKTNIVKSGQHPEDIYRNLWDTITQGHDWSGELINKKKDGTLYWESVMISPIFDSEGEITHFVGVKDDITEKRQMVEELTRAKEKAEESDRLKSAFLANMSHEIRTPMNGIVGFIDLLQFPDLTSDERAQYFSLVKESTNRLMITIDNLMEISRIEAGQEKIHFSDFNLYELLQYYHGLYKPEAEIKSLELLIQSDIPENMLITGDKSKLGSVFSNLINNAIKFTSIGSVEFGCKIVPGKRLAFSVRDSGPGIPAEKHDIIFERFTQAESDLNRPYEGSGLGLSIVKAYTEMLGGKIEVKSAPGEGSEFIVTVPLMISENPETAVAGKDTGSVSNEASDRKAGSETNALILVAEDDETSISYLDKILADNKFRVIIARNGAEAVKMFEQNPDISIVLMDIKMPVMDGLEATRRLRKINDKIPIIAQTAYALPAEAESIAAAGCTDYISKPTNRTDLIALINKYL
ncbi:MAG: response regulator [Bacteroidales bacterium]|nr:response regulator [Bacteroidales bacterium]